MPARTDRESVRAKSVTYVLGINCHPCVQNGHRENGSSGWIRTSNPPVNRLMQVVYLVGSSSVYLALDSPCCVVFGAELFTVGKVNALARSVAGLDQSPDGVLELRVLSACDPKKSVRPEIRATSRRPSDLPTTLLPRASFGRLEPVTCRGHQISITEPDDSSITTPLADRRGFSFTWRSDRVFAEYRCQALL